MEPNVPSDISTRAERCIRLFERWQLSNDSKSPEPENSAALFRLWTMNNFVFTQDHMCLDWRLRNTGVIATVVKDLLDCLEARLSEVIETSSGAGGVANKLVEVEDIQRELLDICRAVHRSGILSRFSKLHGYTEALEVDGKFIDLSELFRNSVFTFIERRHPRASILTKTRLADTISIRRQNFSYLRDREQRASEALHTRRAAEEVSAAVSQTHLLTQRVSQPELALAEAVNTKGTHQEEENSEFFAALTANADKVFKTTSIRPSSAFRRDSHATDSIIPRHPRGTSGTSHLKCPYCFLVCPVQELREDRWRNHFIQDLKPYVCLLDECPTPDVLFESFREWTVHMTNQHSRRRWVCSNRSHKEPYQSYDIKAFTNHMKSVHEGKFLDSDLEELVEASLVPEPRRILLTECPLCVDFYDTDSTPINDVLNHVADHLILLAMLSLPDNDGCDIDESNKFASRSDWTSSLQISVSSRTRRGLEGEDAIGEDAFTLSSDIKNIPDLDLAEVVDWRLMWSEWKGRPFPTYDEPKLKSLEYRPSHGISEDWRLDTSGQASIFEDSEDDQLAERTKHYLPLPRNRHFVGREEVISDIQRSLFTGSNNRSIALVGPSGLGKTRVALQVAHLVEGNAFGQNNHAVLWISASTMTNFEQACIEIASEFAIECAQNQDPKTAVKSFFSSEKAGNWFLVVDGIDDTGVLYGPEQRPGGIASLLPESRSGRLLFTTQSTEVAAKVADEVLELNEMSMEEAKKVLQESLTKEIRMQNDDPVDELLEKLARLPLAIAQASAYMSVNKVPIKDYLELLQDADQTILGFDFGDEESHYLRDFAATCTVSFNQIRETDEDATELLCFIACVEPKTIPRTLLLGSGSEHRVQRAIGTLCEYGFLSQQEDGEIFDMHSLVHSMAASWITNLGFGTQQREAAITHLTQVFPIDDWKTSKLWRRYLPHALKILYTTSTKDKEICEVGDWVGRCLLRDGQIQHAINLLELMVTIKRGTLTMYHPSRLASQHTLAKAYHADGQETKAKRLLERVVNLQRGILKNNDPSQLASQHNLAGAYYADGRVKKASDLLEHVVTEEEVLAQNHPSRLASRHELARAYQASGRIEEAIDLLQNVVTIQQQTLPEENPNRLASQHNLAEAYKANGQIDKAVDLLEIVVTIESRVLAEDNPSRLTSEHSLAEAYKANTQLGKAIQLLQHVVKMREKILAKEHPDRLASERILHEYFWEYSLL